MEGRMRSLSLIILLGLTQLPTARGNYLLVTYFHYYQNSLHSFIDTSVSPYTAHCCDGQQTPNCTSPCNTVLNYCFKDAEATNDFTNDSKVLNDCIDVRRSLTELVVPRDFIDFSDPPLTVSGSETWSSIPNRGRTWPGKIQFFVRATSKGEIIDYLSTEIKLNPGQNLTNETLVGYHFGDSVSLTVSITLECTFNFYGENCSIYCKPGHSVDDGFYSCSSEGARVCNEKFAGSDCKIDLDVCGHAGPCEEGNCTNTGPDSYQCTCDEGYHGMNCSAVETEVPEDRDVEMSMTYLLLIVAGVVGLLAPVVILSPLLLILCFTAVGSWRSKKKEYVNNPLYGESSAPASGTSTFRSETTTDPSSTAEMIHVNTDSSTDTLSPHRMSGDDPNYASIPAGLNYPPGNRASLVAPSVTDAFRSDENNNYYTLSISTNESVCPYNYLPDYDVPPPPLPTRGLPPSVPNSYKSESGHSFLEMTSIDSQPYYQHPLPHDPVTHSDVAATSNTNGALWVAPTVSFNQQYGLRRSKTIGTHSHHPRAGVRRSNSFKNRSWRHHHHHHHHRRVCKSGSTGGYYTSSRHYQYALDQPKMTPYGQRRGLPPVPPHGLNYQQRHNQLSSNSFDVDRRALTLDSESSAVFSRSTGLQDSERSQMFGSESTVGTVGSDMGQSGWSVRTEDITVASPYLEPPRIVIPEDVPGNPRYDEVPVELPRHEYDDLVIKQTGYELYDVPRKADNSTSA